MCHAIRLLLHFRPALLAERHVLAVLGLARGHFTCDTPPTDFVGLSVLAACACMANYITEVTGEKT
jgi:hypothetical protein